MKTARVHAELIKAWADGATVQAKAANGEWFDCRTPSWFPQDEYRIRPEPRPDVTLYCWVDNLVLDDPNLYGFITNAREHYKGDNLRLTFDGETGKLKSAEVI